MDAASYGSRATDGNVVREARLRGCCLGRRTGPARWRARRRASRYAARAVASSAGPAPSNRDRLRYVEGETSWWRRKAFANWAGWR
jgi:hypothetical protein